MADERDKGPAEKRFRILGIKMDARWRSLIVRAAIAALVAWILATAPLPAVPSHIWVVYVQVPIVILLFICYLGKLLIDTFFYNRYRP